MVLPQILVADLFAFFIVFARIGATIMVMPGFGEIYVAPRFRLVIALAITLAITPALGTALPAMPGSPARLFLLLFGEIMTGVFLGLVGRIIMMALHTGGTVLSFQTGLANALGYEPIASEQSAITASFLLTAGLLMVFVTDLHHVMLRALVASYDVIVPGRMPPIDDFSYVITRVVGDSFILGVQLAAPFIAVGLVFYLGVGLLARLMPQVQIFFIAMPVQIFLGFAAFALTAGAILTWFTNRFPDFFAGALGA